MHADFQKKSQRTFSTIALAISTQQLNLITSFENPMGCPVQTFLEENVGYQIVGLVQK